MSPKSLVWVDRKGHEEPIKAPPHAYGPPRVSPDGMSLLLGIIDRESNDEWIWDFERETLKRLTFAPGSDALWLWTPDGRRIILRRTARACLTCTARPPTAPVPPTG